MPGVWGGRAPASLIELSTFNFRPSLLSIPFFFKLLRTLFHHGRYTTLLESIRCALFPSPRRCTPLRLSSCPFLPYACFLTPLLRYFDLPTAFLQRVDGIGGKIFKSLDQAAGPAHLHPINLCRSAEAEMDAHVVIGNVAGAAAHFVNESARACFHRDSCPDAVAVGFDPDRPKRDPVVPVARVVDQKRRRSVHVADDCGHAAIIPQIADRQTARRTCCRDRGTRGRGNIREGSVAIVVIENPGLLEVAAEMLAIHFGVDVAVGEEQIGPAVVVEIEKRNAPAEVLRVEPESRGKGFVVEGAVAIVVVKNAGGAVAGDINVRPAVVVVIKSGNAEGVMPVGLIDAG